MLESGAAYVPPIFMDPLLTILNGRFEKIDRRSRQLLSKISDGDLYRRPRELDRELVPFSVGEYVVRSAAMVEQTFGGITTRLWDDPFEWTLPEKLSTKVSVLEYLDEVDAVRADGFKFLSSDAALTSKIPAPVDIRTIFEILLETLGRAEHYQGRAFAIFQILFDEALPKI
jgi:hypothetical protein